jgi:hypothetical protein
MKKIAIKGSKNHEEQKEIIEILKSLGGRNKHNFTGDIYWAYYYINSADIIDTTCDMDNLKGYVLLTLEQYKEKYKYMKNKELQIIPPEGYEVDKENSTFEKIVFKKVEEKLTYEKIAEKLFQYERHYYTDSNGKIKEISLGWHCPNAAPTEYQLQRLLALNKLMNVSYYLNDSWKPDWDNYTQNKYFLCYNNENKTIITKFHNLSNSGVVYFKSKELTEQALEILGEETIKLALGVC